MGNKVLAADRPEVSGEAYSPPQLRCSHVGSAAKTLFRLRLQYRQLRNPLAARAQNKSRMRPK